ncbi:acr3 [Symbiodinium sp. KB8]|nr:acr3 [Symbiodinium sp. KB8]
MSLVLNWLIGPALMFALAWILLPDLPEYRTGLIIVGLARCIAMVLIWNDLACGSRELAAVLVAINSLFQIVAYSILGYFYLELLPEWLGLDSDGIDVTMWEIAKSGEQITEQPWDVARIAVPLLIYFALMWFGSFFAGLKMGFPYERNTSIAFTAAGNNFELAIAVSIGVFGVTSGQALAGVVGPLIEVPVLVALVYVSLWAKRRYYDTDGVPPRS